MDIKEYFSLYNEIAEKYPESELIYSMQGGQAREGLVRMFSKYFIEGIVLDLGCNNGHYSYLFNEDFSEEDEDGYSNYYVGVDIARAVLKRFPWTVIESGNAYCLAYKKDRIQAVAEFLPFRNGAIGNILLSEVLEHVYDRDALLKECRRVLNKDTGKILITTPQGDSSDRADQEVWFDILSSYKVGKRAYQHGAFTEAYLKDMLERNGFSVELIQSMGGWQLLALAH